MKYIESHQQGGQVNPMKQLENLVKAAMAGDQEATKQIDDIMTAAQQGNPQAQKLAGAIQKIAQRLQASQTQMAKKGAKIEEKQEDDKIKYLRGLKCGGKAKKPTKAEKGAKAKCGCMLQRLGGRIVEVDSCTGLPIDKNK